MPVFQNRKNWEHLVICDSLPIQNLYSVDMYLTCATLVNRHIWYKQLTFLYTCSLCCCNNARDCFPTLLNPFTYIIIIILNIHFLLIIITILIITPLHTDYKYYFMHWGTEYIKLLHILQIAIHYLLNKQKNLNVFTKNYLLVICQLFCVLIEWLFAGDCCQFLSWPHSIIQN